MNPQQPNQPNNQQPNQPPPPQAQVPQQPAQQSAAQPPQPQQTQQTTANPKKKPVSNNPNSTQNTLQIAEIRDGIVIMNDGSFRSVIMTKSINFDLMSQQEREGVEMGYQNFLNSLDFPIQIFVRSKRVDITPYIDRLDKIRSEHDNMLLAMLMEDYIGYIDELSQQVNIMDKVFYVVIPYFPGMTSKIQNQQFGSNKSLLSGLTGMFGRKDTRVTIDEQKLESAKTELRNRVQSILSGLMECGVQGLPLDTQELIELYYDTYNPDTATRQQLGNIDNLTADVVTKGEGRSIQPHLQGEL